MNAVSHIVVGTDGSEGAKRAVAWAAGLAAALGARVTLVRGYNPLDDLGRPSATSGDLHQLEERARDALHGAGCQPFIDAGVEHTAILIEDEGFAAIEQVVTSDQADLVIVGSHGQTGWRERILGSVATKVTNHVPCPVTIVPAPRPDSP